MAEIINTGRTKIAQASAAELAIDRFVFAMIPGLDTSAPVNLGEAMPEPEHIVHVEPVTAHGYVATDKVVYSIILGPDVGDFEFNWVGLQHEDDTLIAVRYTPTQSKYSTQGLNLGNTLTRNFLLQFQNAVALTGITVSAETWQIDFMGRLDSQDEHRRLDMETVYGGSLFINDGLQVFVSGSDVMVRAGYGYVGGLRVMLPADVILETGPLPKDVYVDAALIGDASESEVVATFETSPSSTPLSDYSDAAGIAHKVVKIATVASNLTVTDLRQTLAVPSSIIAALLNRDNHTGEVPWNEISGKPSFATRWPAWSEVSGKPSTFPPSAHGHTWGEISDKPASFPPSAHGHPSSEISGLGNAATRNVGTASGTVAAGDDSRITGAAQKSQNLNDLANKTTAFNNIKQAATEAATGVVQAATSEQAKSGTAGRYPDAAKVLEAIMQFGLGSINFSSSSILSSVSLALNSRNTGFYRYASSCTEKPSATNGAMLQVTRNSTAISFFAVDDDGIFYSAFWGGSGSINWRIGASTANGYSPLGTAEVRTYSSSEQDILDLVPGSTAGLLLAGWLNGHAVVKIKANDSADGFHIIATAINDPSGPAVTSLLHITQGGIARVHGKDILKKGDYGPGTDSDPGPTVTNVDTAFTVGSFRLASNASGDHPWFGSSSSLIVTRPGVNGWVHHFAMRGNSNSLIRFRSYNGTSWSLWNDITTSETFNPASKADAPISATVELGGDFDSGKQVKCERVGNVVTITGLGILTHATGISAVSAAGIIPSAYRPTTNSVTGTYYSSATVGANGVIGMVSIGTSGSLSLFYSDYTGSTTSRINSVLTPTISFVIT